MTVTNTVPPTISGTATQGQLLSTSNGSWTFDEDYLTYAYQWLRCDAAGANCVDIGGATSANYLLTLADVAHTLRSQVTATEHTTPVGDYGTYDSPWGASSPWRTSAVVRPAHANSAGFMSTLISGVGEVDVNRGGFTCSIWSNTYHTFATANWSQTIDNWFLDNVYYPTDYTDATSFGEWHAAWFDVANNRIACSIKANSPAVKTYRGMNFFHLDGSGWWNNAGDGYYAPRVSGAAPNAGVITRYDLAQSEFTHALACCLPSNLGAAGSVLSPATTTDATGIGANKVPMGACIVLNSAIDIDTDPDYSVYSSVEKKMLKAIQAYGLYIVDSSSSFSIYAQNYQYGDQAGTITGYPPSPMSSKNWLQDCYVAVAYPNAFTYDNRAAFGGQPHH